ncbi:hypothetical protein ADEAN_000868400 [Angomonas deanei]|uniref:BRCT domain-containing protein n=1 Tax=Angomonas deanei TaxID=59799 RepID=A0A7G2CRK6_9TRYP|nr:hypothetical protein ADEAN_000868400 [Angomonas deanei]
MGRTRGLGWADTAPCGLAHPAMSKRSGGSASLLVSPPLRAPPPRRALRARHRRGATFVYTTGIQLTAREEEQCKALGVVVNPPLHLASSAFVLVVQKPLIRSVKLLTVLPHVRAVVSRSWLTRVLKERQVSVPLDEYPYTEPRSKKSIEAVNGFSLHATLQIPIHVRRRLFSSFTFWVHGDARPQDPPLNDLKSVILSSGGSIATRLSEGKVFVLPNKAPSETVLRRMKSVLSAPDNIFVVPDDVFKCVLQQNGSLSTTVDISARSFTPCKTQGGKSQRSTPAKKRKTI